MDLPDNQGHSIIEASDSLPERISICRHDKTPRLSMKCAQSLIEQGLTNHDIILLDAPSLLDSADAALAIQACGGAILVVRSERDTLEEIRAAARELEKLAPSVVGAIMTCIEADADTGSSNELPDLTQSLRDYSSATAFSNDPVRI